MLFGYTQTKVKTEYASDSVPLVIYDRCDGLVKVTASIDPDEAVHSNGNFLETYFEYTLYRDGIKIQTKPHDRYENGYYEADFGIGDKGYHQIRARYITKRSTGFWAFQSWTYTYHTDYSDVVYINETPDFETKLVSVSPSLSYLIVNKNNKGTLVKISNVGGTGANMFAIDQNPDVVLNAGGILNFYDYEIESLPGYNYVLGTQEFFAYIKDVQVIAGKTIVILEDGKILKVNGTGGSGANMFAVTESKNGFTSVPGYSYYSGSQKFLNEIDDFDYANGYSIISSDDKLIKCTGLGGTGNNMYGIYEDSTTVTSASGYNYLKGYQLFNEGINDVAYVNSKLVIALEDGKVLKINGTGGTGANMFAVTEASNSFTAAPGSAYYSGYQFFENPVSKLNYLNGYLFVSIGSDLLKITGTGGSGVNMFALTESNNNYYTVPGYNYLKGYQKFSNEITHTSFEGGYLYVGLEDGKLLKSTVGGTGANMFAILEDSSGFSTMPFKNYYKGHMLFNNPVNQVQIINGYGFVSTGNKMLKLNSLSGTGANMFAVYETDDSFSSVPGYNYYSGYQFFDCYGVTKFKSEELSSVQEPTSVEDVSTLNIYPNPTSDLVNLVHNLSTGAEIKVYNILGELILQQPLSSGVGVDQIDFSEYDSGIYLFIVTSDDKQLYQQKIIKK